MKKEIKNSFKNAVKDVEKCQRRMVAEIMDLPNPLINHRKWYTRHLIRNTLMLAATGYGLYVGYPVAKPVYDDIVTNHCAIDRNKDIWQQINRERLRFFGSKEQAYLVIDEPVRFRVCPESGDDPANIITHLYKGNMVNQSLAMLRCNF